MVIGSSGPDLRRAGPEDGATIGRLLFDFNTEYDEPTPAPEVIAARVTALIAAGDTIVLLAGDVGLALMRLRPSLWTPGKECYLGELYVVPALRGQGIGRALMDASIAIARAEGADYMELNTGEDDTAARRLYESLGFTNLEGGPDGTRMLYYERTL